MTINLVDNFGVRFDEKVLNWKTELEKSMDTGADTGFQERGVKALCARKIFGHAHKLINHAP